jgi:hypothetical protein
VGGGGGGEGGIAPLAPLVIQHYPSLRSSDVTFWLDTFL